MSNNHTATPSLGDQLLASDVHQAFTGHPFFAAVQADVMSRDQVGRFLGQWWHPLHYFPTFLASCVATLPDIASKSAIARILDQETGGGNPAGAHEVIYAESMAAVGFPQVTEAKPGPETEALVDGYAAAAGERFSALGFIFATETTDLLMVSSIGRAVSQTTGVERNAWVDIHVQQEPDHVEEAGHTLLDGFSPDEQAAIIAAAERMWTLWIGFFDGLSREAGLEPAGAGGDSR